jgi:hypothetical protein
MVSALFHSADERILSPFSPLEALFGRNAMRAERLLLAPSLLLGLAVGCGNTPVVGTDAPVPVTDAPGDTCGPPVLSGGDIFGSSVGTYFENWTLQECDGTPYTFYNEEYCAPEHTLTVVSIAGIWCVPCQNESAQLTDVITEPYRDRGVRVLQIIVDGQTPGTSFTPAECQQWVDTYGLVNTELMDPGGDVTNRYFPDGALPSTLIIDETGQIRFRENGATMGLVSLTSALDSLLAE